MTYQFKKNKWYNWTKQVFYTNETPFDEIIDYLETLDGYKKHIVWHLEYQPDYVKFTVYFRYERDYNWFMLKYS